MSYSSHCFCFHKLTQSKTSDETQSCSAVCAVYLPTYVLLMLKLTVCWDEPNWIKPASFWLILADVILPVEVFSCRKIKSKLVLRSWLYVTRTWVHKFHHQTLMTSIRVDVHMLACFFFTAQTHRIYTTVHQLHVSQAADFKQPSQEYNRTDCLAVGSSAVGVCVRRPA